MSWPIRRTRSDTGARPFERISREQAIDRLFATGVSRADAEYVIGWYADPPTSASTPDGTVARILGRPRAHVRRSG